LAKTERYLDRCKLAANTVKAYRRQSAAYVTWLTSRAADHSDAFTDVVGAEAAVTAWRKHPLRKNKASPATINQGLAAVTLLYEHGPQLRISVKRARIPRPGEPDALSSALQGKVERAAARRGDHRRAALTPAPGSRNANASTSRTLRSPRAPEASGCTARVTKSTTFPSRRRAAAAR
jgi:hypothetical protein